MPIYPYGTDAKKFAMSGFPQEGLHVEAVLR